MAHGSSSAFPPVWMFSLFPVRKEGYLDTYQGAFLQICDINESSQTLIYLRAHFPEGHRYRLMSLATLYHSILLLEIFFTYLGRQYLVL